MPAEPVTTTFKAYAFFVKWLRRTSSFAFTFLILRWVLSGTSPVLEMRVWIAGPISEWALLPVDRALIVVVAVWYAFLSQLKVRWALWLPIYLLLFPVSWVAWTLLRIVGTPVFGYLKSLGENATGSVPQTTPVNRKSFPTKRTWLALLFLWLIVFRGLDLWWAAWIPPILALPIWFFFLRFAYRSSITPRTFARVLVAACSSLLDAQIKTFTEAQEKKTKPTVPATVAYNVANAVLRRYSDDRVVSVVQKESLALFAASLLIALVASSWFWGLVGLGLMHSGDDLLSSYNFFNSGSMFEAILWAWGCMTTTIDFPGSTAPTWLKAIHASILATGLFQLTFLLACFSIMMNTEGTRAATDARNILQQARDKLEQTRALEAVVITVVDVPAESPPEP
jgi:hypothetical protein